MIVNRVMSPEEKPDFIGGGDPYRIVCTTSIAQYRRRHYGFNLGAIYLGGIGVPKDYSLAAMWLSKAAHLRNSSAQYQLGSMFYYGLGIDKDYRQAVEWYRRAADQGNVFAQGNLGWICLTGAGSERNYSESYRME